MATATGTRRRVTPFWHRLPQFFLYPFKPRTLAIFVGMVVITAAAGNMPPIGAALASIALTLFLTKFSLDILAHTAEGHMDPPPLDGETFLQGYALPFKLVGIFLVLGIALLIVGTVLGGLFAILLLLAALVLLPASVMTLAVTHSLAQAVHPGELIRTVQATGWGYVALLGCLFLLNGSASIALNWLAAGLPVEQLIALSLVVQYYFTFVMFHLMGYLLYQYHDHLGYEPEAGVNAAQDVDPRHAGIQEHIDAGNHAAAIEGLKRLIREEEDNLELRLWLHRLAVAAGDDRLVLARAGGLIEKLIDLGRVRDATEIYRTCQDLDPAARPRRPTDYFPLARMLFDANEPDRALRLANGFHRNFPDHPEMPPLYLLVAHILAEHKQQPEKARTLLDFIRRRFPDRPEARQAASLQSALAG